MKPVLLVRSAIAITFLLLIAGCATRPAGPSTFSFAVVGDLQYTPLEERQFPEMLRAIDKEPMAFVVHLGDFKAGGNSPCTDALFRKRFDELNAVAHPLIYIPGDNDWVDCRRPTNGAMDPLERLDKLRQVFFAQPRSLGQKHIALNLQSHASAGDPVLSRYHENAVWLVHRNGKGVVFATVNVQGSNDNVGFDAKNDAEQKERTRANLEWLRFAISRAKGTDIVGLAIFLQANPGFEDKPADVRKSGYVDFLKGFEEQATAFGKPTLFVHGDTHTFRVDSPYQSPLDRRELGNVTRVEGYGSPTMNWVRITVDGDNPKNPFFVESGRYIPPPTQ